MELSNFIKYCLGYVNLTQQGSFLSQQKYSLELSKKYFNLEGLLNGDLDGELGETVALDLFYALDPSEVDGDNKIQYKKEKDLANKIQDIYSKYKNDPFTKQIVFSFGYFEVEIPIEEEINDADEDSDGMHTPKSIVDRYPIFSIPITIEKEESKYVVYFVDPEIKVNVRALETILGEDLYYQLLEDIGAHEMNGDLSLPLTDNKVFYDIWHRIKEKLKLKEAIFNEESFKLDELKISLSPRANYFLAEDLQNLSKLETSELEESCLTSWVDNTDLNIKSDVPGENDLYFPFQYDKFQLNTLSLLKNKVAIIEGPPGTGKSETISNILCHLAATGNSVLFVSQKAQALKVVKDKLKKTEVKYLFGYLPNPASAQLGEEDEIDGISNQLASLQSYINDLMYSRKKPDDTLEEIIDKKIHDQEAFQRIIDAQKDVFDLYEEMKSLENFEFSAVDEEKFRELFSHEQYLEIKKYQEGILSFNKFINSYSKSSLKKEFDNKFSAIDFSDEKYSEQVISIAEDIENTGYDRHSSLARSINNISRNKRLSRVRSKLPREIIDLIDYKLSQDVSRREALEYVSELGMYLQFLESKDIVQQYKELVDNLFIQNGINENKLEELLELQQASGLPDLSIVKEKIIKLSDLKDQVKFLAGSAGDINYLSKDIKALRQRQRQKVSSYIQNIVNEKILSQWQQGITIKQIVRKLSKAFGKSKKAYKTFDNLRKDPDNFNAIRDLIPIWIMELDDASRIIPLEAAMFDYVIIDEASQCNIAYTLPVMFRAKHALFVGDVEQMRDSTVMFKSNKSFDELARRYSIPEEMQIKATGSSVQSVLEISGLRGFMSAPLRYHYRSPRELIGFSNEHFYRPKGKELIALNNNYLTYKDTNRVLINHLVESDWSEEISDKVNIAEAKEILKLFKELRTDEKYLDKSVGILTFFNAQATKLREVFEEAGYREDKDNFKISIIEGIQGDEKDIIVFSLVIRSLDQKNKYIALTGESGDIRADVNRGRVNVAFSRAKLQSHCFYSIPKMPEGIWLKKYIDYIEDSGEVDFYSEELRPFDSYFEEEFYNIAKAELKKNYIIQNQVKSCGFKIDFVISNTKNNKRIAVECDGPCHFENEIDEEYGIHIQSDEERQNILEAAGWDFYRIKYSDWVSDLAHKEEAISDIKRALS